jgi:hypothetical protein
MGCQDGIRSARLRSVFCSLEDAGLRAFMEENVSHLVTPWPPSTLDLGTLSISALYSNPIRYKETSSEKKLK